MKKLALLLIIPITQAAANTPQQGLYTTKVSGENVCIALQSDGSGYYLYSEFGEDYCLANNKENKSGGHAEINQYRCVNNYSSSYSEGFIGSFKSNSFTITGISEIISNGSGPIEQSDYLFSKKYSFKLDTKGVCSSFSARATPSNSELIQEEQGAISRKSFFK